MAIVYQTCKKTGITYAYESFAYWDKEKQQSRAKRKCIGKLDPETGEIVPTRRYMRRSPNPNPAVKKRYFHGATWLLDQIGRSLGITEDLKGCFPETWRQIQSIVYFLILEDSSSLSRFPKWARLHKHPYGQSISSQRSSELFASITEDAKRDFFCRQRKRRAEKEYWAYCITSLSSYSNCLEQVKYGVDKEYCILPQLNLALFFGEESKLPFYYRKLPGKIPDVKNIKDLLADIDFLDHKKAKIVMDRGFYSEENINDLYKHQLKFLGGTKLSLEHVRAELDKVRESIKNRTNYSSEYDLYATPTIMNYTQSRHMYLHLYFNSEKALEDEELQNNLLIKLQAELESDQRKPENEKLYAKYFVANQTAVRDIKVKAKQDLIDQLRRNYGYFAIISNEVKDPIAALELYQIKDLAEKTFGNLKERLNLRSSLLESSGLDSKLFVEFIALIYLAYIKKKMQAHELFKRYTIQSLLDELDLIEYFEQEGSSGRFAEMTKQQRELYVKLGVDPPSP